MSNTFDERGGVPAGGPGQPVSGSAAGWGQPRQGASAHGGGASTSSPFGGNADLAGGSGGSWTMAAPILREEHPVSDQAGAWAGPPARSEQSSLQGPSGSFPAAWSDNSWQQRPAGESAGSPVPVPAPAFGGQEQPAPAFGGPAPAPAEPAGGFGAPAAVPASDPYAPAPAAAATASRPEPVAGPPMGQQAPAEPDAPAGEDDTLTIGRGRGNSIVLDDMLVSRQHVKITVDEEGLVIQDLGSRNGTFVNGRRVEQTHLHEGDRIGIGASTFEVRDGWLVSI